jgi:uncharacterized membrane protein YkoI
MRKLNLICPFLLIAFCTPALSKSPAATPKITKAQATKVALAAVPRGKVETVELETEHHQLVYSFDIRVPGKSGVEEVQVSAITGKIVSQEHESPAKEAIEKAVDPH